MPTTREIANILTRQQYLAADIAALINAAQQLVTVRIAAAEAVVIANATGNPAPSMIHLGEILAMEGGQAELHAAQAAYDAPVMRNVPAGT